MIVDTLNNAATYRGLPERFQRALAYLASQDLAALPLGRIDLEGDSLFVLVQEYDTKRPEEGRWEAHRRYADIQLVPTGRERIGVGRIEQMQVDAPYDAQRDVGFFQGAGDWITLESGRFAIFFPQDVHLPCIACDAAQRVRKVVAKVEIL
ncbi:MAG: YhcH/YjgK/YiaL family protein [Pirellulales bacterium]